MAKIVERDERPARYVERDEETGEETVVYRASSVGACPRALLLTGLGYPGRPWSEWFSEVLDEGTRMESQIEAMYTQQTGHPVVDRQREYDLEIVAGVKVRCHIDGRYPFNMSMPPGSGAGMFNEFKKLRPSGWEQFKRVGVEMHNHWLWQMATVQHATQAEYMRLIGGLYDPERDCITEIFIHNYTDPVLPLKAIRRKIIAVELAITNGADPMGVECAPKMWPCPFEAHHDEQPEVRELSKERDAEMLTAWIDEYREVSGEMAKLAEREKPLKAAKDELRGKIEGWLRKAGVAGGEEESWKYTLDGKPISYVYTKGYQDRPMSRKPSRSLRLGKDESE